MDGTEVYARSFERVFLKKAFFLGEHKLDTILMNLLQLLEMTRVFTLPSGSSILMREGKELFRKVRSEYPDIKELWTREKANPNANLGLLCLEKGVPFDFVSPFPFLF